eukprot:1384756-Amorphochlora_amoeboformis.AAC.1
MRKSVSCGHITFRSVPPSWNPVGGILYAMPLAQLWVRVRAGVTIIGFRRDLRVGIYRMIAGNSPC